MLDNKLQSIEWQTQTTSETISKLESQETGLTQEEAKKRLETFGPNKLVEEKKISPLKLFLDQFKGALVIVLIIAAIVSFAIQDYIEGVTILAIVIINACLGFFQEYKAEKSLEALKKMTALNTTVLRDGKPQNIDVTDIVPGDIIILHTGDKVPADLRLIEAVNLKIDEAILTGESRASSKQTQPLAQKIAVADKTNMAFANTIVTYGRATGIVVETGKQTEFGKIATLIKDIQEEDTPLKKRLEALGKFLIKIVTGIIVLLFVIGLIEGTDWHEMFKVAISLGVAAIPEGLPAVITITLSIGVFQMAKKNALTRRMPAVEALGSTTVVCSDKTGTLTRNEMVVEKIYTNNKLFDITGEGYSPTGTFLVDGKQVDSTQEKELSQLLKIAAHCNDAEIISGKNGFEVSGDPTEGCLVAVSQKANILKTEKRIDEIQFDSDRKMMTTLHDISGKKIAFSKGAVEKIISLSTHVFENGKVTLFTPEKKKIILDKAEQLAKQAYRILGFSYKENTTKESAEQAMVFVGFAALNDPIRDGVKDAIETATQAGIKIKIITGDNPLTASAVALKLGINPKTISGKELDELSEEEFDRIVREINVFARVSPEHKLKIVTSLKKQGEIVAVTGDGVNDAPALKKADIGIAMGIKGTDVTKEAADLILKDDNFATIVTAISEGRRVYNNIKSFVKYLLAANIGEVFIIGASIIFNFALPILPLQLLWLNIVTDSLPALALGTEQSDKSEMKKKPRNPNENILDDMKIFILIAGILSAIIVFIAFFYGLQQDALSGGTLAFLNTKEGFDFESKARTMAFTTLVVFELFFVFSCRHQSKGILTDNPLTNSFLVKMVIVSFILQLFAIYTPEVIGLNIFNTVELNLFDWVIVILLGMTSFLVPYIDNFAKKILTKNQSPSIN